MAKAKVTFHAREKRIPASIDIEGPIEIPASVEEVVKEFRYTLGTPSANEFRFGGLVVLEGVVEMLTQRQIHLNTQNR